MNTRMRSLDEVITFLDDLPTVIAFRRRLERKSIRVTAAEIGISPTGLNQIEHGQNYTVGSLKLILEWLNGNHSGKQSGADGVSDDPTLFPEPDAGSDHPVDGGEQGGVGVSRSDADRASSDIGS